MALKWIKQNIQTFGGDPENISDHNFRVLIFPHNFHLFSFVIAIALFGPSAGGVSTHLHCISEMSRGLFHKAMMLSGNMHSEWAKHGVPNATTQLAKHLGWDEEGGEMALLAYLQTCTSKRIVKAQNEIISAYVIHCELLNN